ncbi:MAG: flagellar export chaperone FliS [Ktedonobacterales bacterium]|nr:flagellar export chaperone FliS [Ktedonobacterales bacterium]
MTTAMTNAQAALARAKAARAQQQYQQTQAQTVSPGQLVVMLYDGVVRFSRRAHAALTTHDYETAHNALCRAQDIIAELDATLDDRAGAISTNLHRIYQYCLLRLVEANVEKRTEPVDEIIAHFMALADSWRQAIASVEQVGRPGNAESVGIEVTK